MVQIGKLEKAYEECIKQNQALQEQLKNLGKGELPENVEVLAPFVPSLELLPFHDLIAAMKKAEITGKIESLAYHNPKLLIELESEVQKMKAIRQYIANINSQEETQSNTRSKAPLQTVTTQSLAKIRHINLAALGALSAFLFPEA